MFLWGEADVIWTEGIVALVRWHKERRAAAGCVAQLVAETEAWLAAGASSTEPPGWPDTII